MPEQQNFKNHGRVVPMFHFGVFLGLAVNLIWALYRFRGGLTGDAVVNLLLAISLVLMALSLRVQILTVQDRIIRVEMQHRMRRLLPADVYARAAALPVKQLVALRFSSDEEMQGLIREVLDGKLTTGKEIKMRVRDWQADYLRA